MKVDAKIVPSEERGFFSKKKVYELQYTILLTDVEKAIINKHGLRDIVILTRRTDDDVDHIIHGWVNNTFRSHGSRKRPTLLEAQSDLQQLKNNLTELKQLIEAANNAPTEESFEL